jgi:hypothetical protein
MNSFGNVHVIMLHFECSHSVLLSGGGGRDAFLPAILALYAAPTPHSESLATAAAAPAHFVPCLIENGGKKVQKNLKLYSPFMKINKTEEADMEKFIELIIWISVSHKH